MKMNALAEKEVSLNIYFWLAVLGALDAVAKKNKDQTLADKALNDLWLRIAESLPLKAIQGDQLVNGRIQRVCKVKLLQNDWILLHAALEEWILASTVNAAIDAEISIQIIVEPPAVAPTETEPGTAPTSSPTTEAVQALATVTATMRPPYGQPKPA